MRTRSGLLFITVLIATLNACSTDTFGPLSAAKQKDPANASAKPLSSSAVRVTWTDSSPNETSFRVERAPSTSGPWALAGTVKANDVTFDDAGRSSEQQACYRVFAVLPSGLSGSSNVACTTPPAAPGKLSATIYDYQSIDLTWVDKSAVEDGYEIERASAATGPFAVVAAVAPNTGTSRQGGLTTGKPYWFRVRATKDGGYGDYSNVASETPRYTAPNAPSGLVARPQASYIQVTWVDNANNEDGFRLERSLDGGATWTSIQTVPKNYGGGQDYNLSQDQVACYRGVAFNAYGEGVSASVCTAIPRAPSNASTAVVDGAIELQWTDNSSVEDGFDVWRMASVEGFYRLAATLPANTSLFRDLTALPDQQYFYYVQAKRDGGVSYSSDPVSAVLATTAPAAPSGVFANAPWSSTQLQVFWQDNSANEAGFRIGHSFDNGGTWLEAGTTDGYSGLIFYDDQLTPEQPVCYRVFAYNLRGDSPASNVFCTTPPAAASGLRTTMTSDGLLLTWTDNSSVEDGYVISFWTVCGEPEYWIADLPPNTTSYLLGFVSAGSWCGDYPVAYVLVYKDGGYGDYSEGITTDPSAVGTAARVSAPTPSRQGMRVRDQKP